MLQDSFETQINIGVDNAFNYMQTTGFTPSLETITELKEILKAIWTNTSENQFNESLKTLIPKIIELIAISQFERFRKDNTFAERPEIEIALWLAWKIFERWLNPPKPKK